MTVARRLRDLGLVVKLAVLLLPADASAHVSEQGFVLLLPTGVYSTAGVSVVTLTVLLLFAVPAQFVRRVFRARRFKGSDFRHARMCSSLLSLLLLVLILHIGFNGPRDPLSNLMPLMFWTVGWVGLVSLAGFVGDMWRWINPWTGLYRLAGPLRAPLPLPEALGLWPAVVLLTGFAAFLLADIAPDDPARLALLAGTYLFLTMAGLILCGPAWLRQVELGSVIFSTYALLAPVRNGAGGGAGLPGWRLVEGSNNRAVGIFALTLLGVGSFDGLNETFWWLATIRVNPLAFPGRSAVVLPTLLGLVASIVGLIGVFALTVWLGLALTRSVGRFREVFGKLALSMLPIALAYHIAHYLTSFLVNVQYTVAALSDPFASGADYLGIQPFYVTTGFFNHIEAVRVIWLAQAGTIVIGHVWSVLLAHRMTLDLFPGSRRAAVATLPLSIFMIGYTILGLWLLATPKGG